MKIENLVRADVTTCTIHDTLERAAQLMWEHDVGCLPVIDDQGHVSGMLTDRDICMASYTQGKPLRAIPVTTAMAKRVFTCRASDDTFAVEQIMREHQIRRMPVIDETGHVVGIVSLNDLARASIRGKLPPGEIMATLAAVTDPRHLATATS